MTIRICLFLSLLFQLTGASAQPLSNALADSLTQILRQYVAADAPGMAVGIVRNGQVVYEQYFGHSNLDHQVKINEHTRFNIASNAKQFTALSLLELAAQQKLNLDDDIRTYLPDFYPGISEKISIAQLINHTSGIRDVYELWSLQGKTWWQLFLDNGDALELLQSQQELNFEPGSEYLYSNSNYILLTAIVEKVTGKSFAAYTEQLFQNLGMKETAFLTNYMAVIPHKARPYGNWNGWKEYPAITEIHGDGALFTTLRDQLEWEIIIQENKGTLLSQNTLQQSQAPLAGSTNTAYGFGLMFGQYKGLSYTYHDGNTGAYNATFLRFPDQKTAIVVLSNSGSISTNFVATQLADRCLPLEDANAAAFPAGPDKIDPDFQPKGIVGTYKTSSGSIIKIVEKEGAFYREMAQRDPVQLINESGNLFYYENNEALKMAFTKDAANQWLFTIYLDSQAPIIGTRLSDDPVDPVYLKSLNGEYHNAETAMTIQLEYRDNNTYTIMRNGQELEGQLPAKDLLIVYNYELIVDRNKVGNIEGLILNGNRIRQLKFIKK